MRAIATVWRREVLSYFYSPIAYVLGSAFWALNGFSLWALMKALSDPREPAEVGAVLRHFFGGTLLHWLVVFSLLSLLSMGRVAEERRNGMWEAMLSTRVSASSIVLAKWMALVSFYLLLWTPTFVLVWIFSLFLPPEQSIDLGPVAAAYLGVFAIGAALSAIGVAVSCLTTNQVVAGVTSLGLFLGWLMFGEFSILGSTGGSSWVFFVDLRSALASFARGEVQLSILLNLAIVSVLALCFASAVVAQNRAGRKRFQIACIALIVGGASASSLTAKHWSPLDWTENSVNTLDRSTQSVLADIRNEVVVILVRPTDQIFDPVFDEVRRLIGRMKGQQSLLAIREIDPLTTPEKTKEWAFSLGIQSKELSTGGAVIFVQTGRQRVVDFMAMAEYRFSDLGVGTLSEFRAEAAFRQALSEVTLRHRQRLCTSTGHGEFSSVLDGDSPSRERWSRAAKRLVLEGVQLVEITRLHSDSLRACDALVIFGPDRSFSVDELRAVNEYLLEGGNGLIALRSLAGPGEKVLPSSGIKLLLESRGMRSLDAVVVDPDAMIEAPPEWMTYDGYGEHAIVRDFHKRRASIWLPPVALVASSDDVVALVRASSQAWAEHALDDYFERGLFVKDDSDSVETSVALAHQSSKGSRLVLFGSAESLSDHWSERGVGGNERLLVTAILWTLNRDLQLRLPSKGLEHLHLIMSETQLRRSFFYLVLVGPLCFVLLGGFCWWWRRREC